MPLVRKKCPNATFDNTRVRPRALAQTPGLTQSSKYVEMSKTSIKWKEKALSAIAEPNTDMISSAEIVEGIPQPSSAPHGIGESSKSPPTASKPSEKAAPNAASLKESLHKAATKTDYPPELRPIVEAEQRRAAETAANLALCSAAIAQYMAAGPTTTPLVLSLRPTNPPPRAPDARSIPIPAIPALPVKSTWATVAKNGLRQSAVPKSKAVPRPAAKDQKKEAPKAKFDKRLLLCLEKEHPRRKLSPSALREQIQDGLQCTLSDARSVHRVRTGYAILKGKENVRKRLLDVAPKLSDFNAKLEEASNLVAFRIANVPATI
ncbi:EKA-like protein [Blumeria hordei DH14]|uniref:EKA-like protein n=1 Tax=Blumeria graminis f. sp. hordei (strain DH14) TaxID=546991 RepID=N1J753_BLUG1|nr:EKA-like protein [Blumeria hordei DH14]